MNTYFPARMATIKGITVTNMPHKNRLMPASFRPLRNPGPVLIPTTAMKIMSPMLLKAQRVDSGIRPKVRLTARR